MDYKVNIIDEIEIYAVAEAGKTRLAEMGET